MAKRRRTESRPQPASRGVGAPRASAANHGAANQATPATADTPESQPPIWPPPGLPPNRLFLLIAAVLFAGWNAALAWMWLNR